MIYGQRKQQIVDAIDELSKLRGYPPTVRELGDHVGLSSVSSVHAILKRLSREGRITWDERRPRTLRVVRDA